jgi:SAM-dependent methyltransferase
MRSPARRQVYDQIGTTYTSYRKPDARVERQIHQALGPARLVLNVGAGTGSYEPPGCCVGVEPSKLMLAGRPPGSAPVVRGIAEALPFPDGIFTAAMAVLTVHHWTDPVAGLAEMRRVTAGPVVVLSWDAEVFARFWLIRDYLPEVVAAERGLITVDAIAGILAPCRVAVVPVPHDCSDGFSAAYWRRPAMYLNGAVRQAISNLALLDQKVVRRMTENLSRDLSSGAWRETNQALLELEELDCGYRLVVADPA